ncbi:MAG TPA: DUF5671 domain-containing protein [Anaerolineae bacterium]
MGNVRRWYIYLVSLMGLETVAWAVIILLRHLLGGHPYASAMTTAWQISLVLIGLPLFLGHWLWAERLSDREAGERTAALRYLYLHALLVATLSTVAGNAYTLLAWLANRILDAGAIPIGSPLHEPADSLIGIVVMITLWFYHLWVLTEDRSRTAFTPAGKTVRRLYFLGFSAAGLLLTVLAVSGLLYGAARQLTPGASLLRPFWLPGDLARLIVGLALWLPFWQVTQRLYAGGDEDEQGSVSRKVYLYAASFLPALAFLSAATVALADLFRRVLGVAAPDRLTLWHALAVAVTTAPVWAYHAQVVQRDAAAAPERPQQAAIRRIYRYLVAGAGLAAFLIGLAGDTSVVIRSLAGAAGGRSLLVQAAWYSAALLAGLPVWVFLWRQAQALAGALGSEGSVESHSLARRIYLYFFLFAATITVLTSAVYVFARIIGRSLGAILAGNLVSEVGQALAFSLIGAGLWLYHNAVLRRDNARFLAETAQRQASVRIGVVDPGDGTLGRTLMAGLRRRLPEVQLAGFGPAFTTAGNRPAGDEQDLAAVLGRADILVGPWTMAAADCEPNLASAIAGSPARKLLIPTDAPGWQWIGRASPKTDDLIEEALDEVVALAVENARTAPRRLSPAAVAGLVVLVIVMIPVIFALIVASRRLFVSF